MTALNGRLDEWVPWDDSGMRWHRPDHPEDGVHTITPGGKYKDFADFYAKRAEPEPPPPPDPIKARLDDMEARLAVLEAVRVQRT